MGPNSKCNEIEGGHPTTESNKPRPGDDGDVNPAHDLSDDEKLSSKAISLESCEMLISPKARNVLNVVNRIRDELVLSSPGQTVAIRKKITLDDLLACYPILVEILSLLDRTDVRSLQLSGLGLSIDRIVQRKHLISVPCSNSRLVRQTDLKKVSHLDFLGRVGWLPPTNCDNTTATIDEIKRCTGNIWPANFHSGSPEHIDSCRHAHCDCTSYEATGSSHNVCLECNQLAAHHMSALENRRISRLRRTLCSRHTSENTPLARREPCKCREILDTEWRCWGCRKTTRRGLMAIAMRRREFLDEENDGHREDGDADYGQADDRSHSGDSDDSQDRDRNDDPIPSDTAYFCPIAGCPEWVTSHEEGALKLCLACETILLPSAEDHEEDAKHLCYL